MSHPLGWNGRVNTNNRLNPDHHIWNNNGTWWCHFTVHNPDHTKERVRVSLHTKDRDEARERRDFIMRGTSAIVATLPPFHERAGAGVKHANAPDAFETAASTAMVCA